MKLNINLEKDYKKFFLEILINIRIYNHLFFPKFCDIFLLSALKLEIINNDFYKIL
jgi:hypothetical protein